jgi:hypothetical protein
MHAGCGEAWEQLGLVPMDTAAWAACHLSIISKLGDGALAVEAVQGTLPWEQVLTWGNDLKRTLANGVDSAGYAAAFCEAVSAPGGQRSTLWAQIGRELAEFNQEAELNARKGMCSMTEADKTSCVFRLLQCIHEWLHEHLLCSLFAPMVVPAACSHACTPIMFTSPWHHASQHAQCSQSAFCDVHRPRGLGMCFRTPAPRRDSGDV